MMLFPLTTTMPMLCFSPPFVSSTASSRTRFMNGSKPRRIPVTTRLALSLSDSFLSMYFFSSGGCALLILVCCVGNNYTKTFAAGEARVQCTSSL
uniref:Uncharacterized protein n=1 Tax=Rhipicephalus microplus TaxID=6941 RepID=A0A6G5A5C0_RHIMP